MENLIIANPIYDVAFKYLMEDNEIAIGFLSVLLNQKIVNLSLKTQEVILPTDEGKIKILRLDYRATIELEDGTMKKVLIELQKHKIPYDIQRFRTYLGRNYLHPRTKKPSKSKKVKTVNNADDEPMEIVTVYILAFSLPDLAVPVLHVKRQILDAITGEELKKSCNFVELLTHESFIIQIQFLGTKQRTELEQILDIFNQKHVIVMKDGRPLLLKFTKDAKHPLVQKMAQRLEMAASDEAIRQQLEDEAEIEAMLSRIEEDREFEREEKLRERAEKERVIKENIRIEQEKKQMEQENKRILAENAKMMKMLEQLLDKIDKLEKK